MTLQTLILLRNLMEKIVKGFTTNPTDEKKEKLKIMKNIQKKILKIL